MKAFHRHWTTCQRLSLFLYIPFYVSEIFSVRAEECAETEAPANTASSWLPGASNSDFLKSITRPLDKEYAKGDKNNELETGNDPFGFFRLFEGGAHSTDSESFLNLAQFFQTDETKPRNDLDILRDKPDENEWWDSFQRSLNYYQKLVVKIFVQSGNEERKQGFFDILRVFSDAFEEVKAHLNETFGDIGLFEKGDLLQFMYFMDHEEIVKNPVWKRRVHRHYRALTADEAEALYPALFVSYLSYTTSCNEVFKFGQQFGRDEWALRNCTMESQPHNPAHFVAVRKIFEKPSLGPLEFLNAPIRALGNFDSLEVALVIRGTKTVGDMLTDAVLKPAEYRGGKAHDGILRAALRVVETYRDDLKALLEASGRKKMKLWLTGHSLGAGTASLAAIEFIECCSDWMDVEAVGFGTPALLSHELSYKYRDSITTVVTDADCVPRMSGTTLVNAWHRITLHDFSEDLLFEFDHLATVLRSQLVIGQNVAEGLLSDLREWIVKTIEETLRPKIAAAKQSMMPEQEPDLIPPGNCIHLYRDGTAWEGAYVNCTFFQALDVAWHAVDDHLIPVSH